MTASELISVHLSDGATPDEEAALSRLLVTDPAVCRECVIAARVDGALRQRGTGAAADASLATTLETIGIGYPLEPPSASGRRRAWVVGGVAAAGLVMLAAGWGIWRARQSHSAGGPREAAESHLPPSPASAGQVARNVPENKGAVMLVRAGRYHVPPLEFRDQPLDAVLERVLAAVAEVNHRQSPEFQAFELAWQPLDVASASSPPRLTLRTPNLPLDAVLSWLAILTDCTVDWHGQGARLVELLPDAADAGAPVSLRTLKLPAILLVGSTENGGDEGADDVTRPDAEWLHGLGITGSRRTSARLDPAAATLTVELSDAEFARLEAICARLEQSVPPAVSLTVRVLESNERREIATEVVPFEASPRSAGASKKISGIEVTSAPTVLVAPGQPFQIEIGHEPESSEPAASGGMRFAGRMEWAGETVRLTGAVKVHRPAARRDVSSPATGPAHGETPTGSEWREYAADLDGLIPPGHTLVFGLTEKDDDPSLAVHISVEPASARPAPARGIETSGE